MEIACTHLSALSGNRLHASICLKITGTMVLESVSFNKNQPGGWVPPPSAGAKSTAGRRALRRCSEVLFAPTFILERKQQAAAPSAAPHRHPQLAWGAQLRVHASGHTWVLFFSVLLCMGVLSFCKEAPRKKKGSQRAQLSAVCCSRLSITAET